MTLQVLDISPQTYKPHLLHSANRNWIESNCWQDMMVEVLNALGLEPLACCAFTLSTDFEGDQWTLFKFPPEDLRTIFGLEVEEIYVWRPVIEHVEENLLLGRLLTIEADAWFLPDTAGITYRSGHVKTGIVPQKLDRAERKLHYFHNAGYFELSGDDFDGVFGLDRPRDPEVLFPYVEVIKLEHLRRPDPATLRDAALRLTREHLSRRPDTNPMSRFKKRLEGDLAWLESLGEEAFHSYAFATCRQCGANAEVASSFVEWLEGADGQKHASLAVDELRNIAETAKRLQFALARVARHRQVDLDAPFDVLEKAWETAMDVLLSSHGG